MPLKALEIGLRLFELREKPFLGLELAGMDAAAARFHPDRMFEMKHLVVQQILDGAARSVGTIEDAADDDGVVGSVVVAEHTTRVVGAPGECRAAEQTVKEAHIERVEDLVEIVVVAMSG